MRRLKADSHRDSYAPKRVFSHNTATKNRGRRQPCHGFLPCLAEKSFALECFAVLRRRFFPRASSMAVGILCVFRGQRTMLWGKRLAQNCVNPYVSPPKASHFLCTVQKTAQFVHGAEKEVAILPHDFFHLRKHPVPSCTGEIHTCLPRHLTAHWCVIYHQTVLR